MLYLADTNVILRYANPSDAAYVRAKGAVDRVLAAGDQVASTTQNLVEAWNVMTRPAAVNGFGWSIARAESTLSLLESVFPTLPETLAIYPEWRRLVVTYAVNGVKVHDACLAAAMLVHRVTHILTFNTADFVRYAPEGIVAVDPAAVP